MDGGVEPVGRQDAGNTEPITRIRSAATIEDVDAPLRSP